jgi:anti-sigma factor RsiW
MNPRRYLLGDLSPAEQAEVDERLLADDELFDQLLAAEEELSEDYLEHRLSRHERRLFEERVLASAPRRRNLELTRALRRRAPTPARRRLPSRRWMAAAGLAGAAAATLLLVRPRPGGEAGVISAWLSAGLVRGQSTTPEVRVPPGTGVVQLQLPLADGDAADARYRAMLRTAERLLVWTSETLRAQRLRDSPTIVVRVPAPLLRTADYILTLQSASGEDVADYVFRVAD